MCSCSFLIMPGPARLVVVEEPKGDKLLTDVWPSKDCEMNWHTSSFVLPAIIFDRPIPTPSMTASKMAQPIAPFLAALYPPRIAREPPVMKPAPMAFQGSSFLRTPLMAQSNVLKRPPQTPKLPPRTGARILTAVMAPIRLSPYGLFRNPLMPCQIVPPMAPIANAPPKSLRMTQGQGSRP